MSNMPVADSDNPAERCQPAAPSPQANEARLHALLEAAVDCIIAIDDRGVVLSINPAGEKLFGYASEDLQGRNVSMLMPPPYRDEHDGYLARYLATGEKRIIGIGREALGRRQDGSTFPIDLSVAEFWSESGRRFVGIVRDISERKRAEAALRESKARLEQAVAALEAKNEELKSTTQQLWQAAKLASVGELAASVAHELNNPLATIVLRIESALTQTPASDPRRRGLEIVAQEARRMGDLLGNLLHFARRGREESSTVDVKQELIKAAELIHPLLRKRRIEIRMDLAPDTPLLYADRQKLRQVFLNLLANAGDAMTNGGVLTLRTNASSRGSTPIVCIEVSDTGVGISARHLQKVMEPFFTTKEEGKGTGLGLAICRRIVTEHRGEIEIQSAEGKGTTVRLTLPASGGVNATALQPSD